MGMLPDRETCKYDIGLQVPCAGEGKEEKGESVGDAIGCLSRSLSLSLSLSRWFLATPDHDHMWHDHATPEFRLLLDLC